MTDRELIELGALKLAARHGFAAPEDMRQRDLEYLCERIEESSGILISLSTIKRILNGQYNRLPQVATLNALSVYLGYADWQAFKAANSRPAAAEQPHPPAATEHLHRPAAAQRLPQPIAARSKRSPWRRPRAVVAAGIVAVLLIVLLSWKYLSRSPLRGDSSAAFTMRRTTSNAVPNTVVFTYDIDGLSGDSFFIQQSWDKNRRVRIYKNSHTLTDIYYEPGYHIAKLFANDRIVKTIDVSIPTDRWFFYSKESLTRGLPAYIRTDSPFHRGILGLDKPTLIANKVDPEKPQVYLYTFFPAGIGADANNFQLTARLKMTEARNTACPFIMTEVYCQRGFMYCTFTEPGCTGGISAQFGDKVIDGKNNDLSPLAFDVHQWHRLEIVSRERQVTVSLDGKVLLTSAYTVSSGLMTGLGFHSNGLCEVDSIRLAGLDGKMLYPRVPQ